MPGFDITEATAFLTWMLDGVVAEGRGDEMLTLPVAPRGRLWLGRLAPEIVVQNSRLGERSERLEPCEVGVRLRLSDLDGRTVRCSASIVVWGEFDGGDEPDAPKWRKSDPIEVVADVPTPRTIGSIESAGRANFAAGLAAAGASGMECEFHAELEVGKDGHELVVTLVNLSPEEIDGWDTNVYEARFEVDAGETLPFTLDNLPDSFRYDRTVAAYGVNGGVDQLGPTTFRTTDVAVHDQRRPTYWDDEIGERPDICFATLASDPLPTLRQLVDACARWGAAHWGPDVLAARSAAEAWDEGMRSEAADEAAKFFDELDRLRAGMALLETNADLLRSFMLANRAFHESPVVAHTDWRPFQLGFLLANVASIVDEDPTGSRSVVDTLWFATGGGKTETYLLYVLTAAFHDRLRGKREGITSWGRFPLRMLSLQQTQRFADVLAAAELVRRAEKIGGARVRVGILRRSRGHSQQDQEGRSTRGTEVQGPRHARALPGAAALPVLRLQRPRDEFRCDALDGRPRVPVAELSVGRQATAVPHRRRRDLPLAADDRARHARQGREHLDAGCDARLLWATIRALPDAGPRIHVRTTERLSGRVSVPGMHGDVGSARSGPKSLRTDDPYAGRTPPAARQPRRCRLPLRGAARRPPDPLRVRAEDHRVVGNTRRPRRTGRCSVPPTGSHLPTSRSRSRALVLVTHDG